MSTENCYRFKLGAFEGIVVSDGFFTYPHLKSKQTIYDT